MEEEIKEELNQEEQHQETEDNTSVKDGLFESEFSKENQDETEKSSSESSAEKVEDVSSSKKDKRGSTKISPEQKAKGRKKALIITAAVVVIVAIFFSICSVINATGFKELIKYGNTFSKVEYEHQLVPEKDLDGYWTFETNNDFKIMQLTDVHIGGGAFSRQNDEWSLTAVANMITAEKPDLVIVTGDIAYPVPFQAGTFNNLNATKIFANMMEKLGVYWTFTYGNHDTEAYSMYSREDICTYYENSGFKYCLFQRGFSSEERGYGNTIIKVKNTAGIVTQALVLLDSHSYIDGDILGIFWKYDNLHQSQVDWYKAEMDKLLAENKKINASGPDTVSNLAFFHIPLEEYRNAYVEYKNNGYQDTANVTNVKGIIGEKDYEKNGVRTHGILCGLNQDNFFEVGSANGLKGIYCGHDHLNNITMTYKGVELVYGMSIDYLAYPGIYKDHEQRGATVITTKFDYSHTTKLLNYYSDYGFPYERE